MTEPTGIRITRGRSVFEFSEYELSYALFRFAFLNFTWITDMSGNLVDVTHGAWVNCWLKNDAVGLRGELSKKYSSVISTGE